MPSFDVVSEVDHHELDNALDQANREVGTRFDFKGADAAYTCRINPFTWKRKMNFKSSRCWIFFILKLPNEKLI